MRMYRVEQAGMDKSFWLPFFKKGVLFFFKKKNQKTFILCLLDLHRIFGFRGLRRPGVFA